MSPVSAGKHGKFFKTFRLLERTRLTTRRAIASLFLTPIYPRMYCMQADSRAFRWRESCIEICHYRHRRVEQQTRTFKLRFYPLVDKNETADLCCCDLFSDMFVDVTVQCFSTSACSRFFDAVEYAGLTETEVEIRLFVSI